MRRNPSNSSKGVPRPQQRGPAHGMWKGDAVGLTALHDWVHLRLPRPDACQKCGVTGKPLDLHNINKKYTRDLSQWIYLCKKCHAEEEAPAREACQTPVARKRRGDALRGRKRPPEVGRKVSAAKMGHTVSEETRKKLSLALRRKPRITVKCACGCGASLTTPDSQGRDRTCIKGHNATTKIGRKYPNRKSPKAKGGA